MPYFSCITEIKPTANVSEAFKDISVAILVGAMPRREGMERKDLLKANVRIFKAQGQALDQFAKKDVKVRHRDTWLSLITNGRDKKWLPRSN